MGDTLLDLAGARPTAFTSGGKKRSPIERGALEDGFASAETFTPAPLDPRTAGRKHYAQEYGVPVKYRPHKNKGQPPTIEPEKMSGKKYLEPLEQPLHKRSFKRIIEQENKGGEIQSQQMRRTKDENGEYMFAKRGVEMTLEETVTTKRRIPEPPKKEIATGKGEISAYAEIQASPYLTRLSRDKTHKQHVEDEEYDQAVKQWLSEREKVEDLQTKSVPYILREERREQDELINEVKNLPKY